MILIVKIAFLFGGLLKAVLSGPHLNSKRAFYESHLTALILPLSMPFNLAPENSDFKVDL